MSDEQDIENETVEVVDTDADETTVSSKKRIGFWGWLLILVILVFAVIGLSIPRLDRNSSTYDTVASLPFVGERIVAMNGASTYQGAAADDPSSSEGAQDQSATDGDEAADADQTGSDQATETDTENSDVSGTESSEGGDADGELAASAADTEKDGEEFVAAVDQKVEDLQSSSDVADSEDGDAGAEATEEGATADDSTEATSNSGATEAGSAQDIEEENLALKEEIESLKADLEKAKENSAASDDAIAKASQTKAISDLEVAAISGMSLEGAVSAAEAQGVAVPENIKSQMEGIPTAIELQDQFGEYATQALRASRQAEAGDRFFAGIRARISAEYIGRSLTPQEGATPDAVLSRAEDNLRNGNLEQSLSEIATLPSEAQSAMEPWVSSANQRLDVLKSIEEMLKSNQTN